MLINLLFWTFITAIILPFGVLITRLFKIESSSIFLTAFLGLLPALLLTTLWGFFFRVNIELTALLTAISVFIYFKQRARIKREIKSFRATWSNLTPSWKWSIAALILFTAFQSAMPTNIPDNGYYYLQTVKWANQVGISLGVAKFGAQYGQFSSWHLLQATFNLGEFFGNRMNNLNGWLLLLFSFWSIHGFSEFKGSRRFYAVFCLTAVVPFFYFITAPSPDLPVILLSLVFFDTWLFGARTTGSGGLGLLLILALTAILIKLSAFFLFFFMIPWFVEKRIPWSALVTGMLVVGVMLVVKSTVTTGAPLYPLTSYTPSFVDWKVDAQILDDGKTVIKNSPVTVNSQGLYDTITSAARWKKWIGYSGYRGLLNVVWLMGIGVVLLIGLFKRDKKLQLLFVFSFVHAVVLLWFSPNYRFAIPIILVNGFIVVDFVVAKMNMEVFLKYAYVLPFLALIWFTPLIAPVLGLSSNSVIATRYAPKLEYLILPAVPFVSDQYDVRNFSGEEVHVPPGYHYCWDGPLPCVMRRHVEKYGSTSVPDKSN